MTPTDIDKFGGGYRGLRSVGEPASVTAIRALDQDGLVAFIRLVRPRASAIRPRDDADSFHPDTDGFDPDA